MQNFKHNAIDDLGVNDLENIIAKLDQGYTVICENGAFMKEQE